jgi:hypothetical protein
VPKFSIGDIVAILTAVVIGSSVFFGLEGKVNKNSADIVESKTEFRRELRRVDDNANEDRREILERLDETKRSMETIRVESSEGRLKIEHKIDRLIERELNQ